MVARSDANGEEKRRRPTLVLTKSRYTRQRRGCELIKGRGQTRNKDVDGDGDGAEEVSEPNKRLANDADRADQLLRRVIGRLSFDGGVQLLAHESITGQSMRPCHRQTLFRIESHPRPLDRYAVVTGGECHLPPPPIQHLVQIKSNQINTVSRVHLHFHLAHNVSAITPGSVSQRRMTETDPSEIPLDIETLKTFTFARVLSQAPSSGSVYLLGKLRDVDAIVHLQQSVLPTEQASEIIQHGLERLDVYLENRPYFSSHAWLASRSFPDLIIKVICPATETHIKKYTAQERAMVSETAEMYERVVVPYIHSFPPSRVEWVYNILAGKKEAERVLYKDDDPDHGFMILPDLKWDQTSMSALYLTVLVQTRSIRTLRDLTPAHLPMLNKIRQAVYSTCTDEFGVAKNKLRLFIHYQPSYYHLHVHVVHIESEGFMGMTVGQAHLLDDVISLLELSPPTPEPSILARMTLTYLLGVEHGLYQPLVEASKANEDKDKANESKDKA